MTKIVISMATLLVLACPLACTKGGSDANESNAEPYVKPNISSDDLLPEGVAGSPFVPPSGSLEEFTADCNTQKLAIVGGQRVTAAHSIALSTVKIMFTFKGSCTGTLLSPTVILTAAHCMANSQDVSLLSLGLGPEGKATDITIAEIIVHPDFKGLDGLKRDDQESLNDVALIRLSKPVPSPYRGVPIANPQAFQAGDKAVTAGFGALAEKDLQVRPLSAVATKLLKLMPELNEIQLETGTGVGPCYGDSGGPTYIMDPTSTDSCLQLVGVTTGPSRGKNYICDEGSGTLMDVTRFQEWIQSSISAFYPFAPADSK